MYTPEEKKHFSLMCTMYVDASNDTLSYTHVNSYVIRRVQPLGTYITNIWALETLNMFKKYHVVSQNNQTYEEFNVLDFLKIWHDM